MAKIEWNKVTWYSKLIAVVVFLAVFAWAFYLGMQYGKAYQIENTTASGNSGGLSLTPSTSPATPAPATASITESLINNVAFTCDAGKKINAQFMQNTVGQGSVQLELSDGRTFILPQAVSADGARYAPSDDSFVFWEKGNGAFVEEGAPYSTSGQTMTYSNCVAPASQQ